MRYARTAIAGLIVARCLCAQAAGPEAVRPTLVNEGKPLRVPFRCSSDDINSLGLACTIEEPCPVYLEFIGIETVGSKMFLSGNLHTSAITLSSILLSSEDDGRTWTEPYERIRSGGLDQIQFVDFERGWVAGHQLHALPRDPFFLLTTDGGKIWRRRPVLSENQPGTIEQFWFESRDRGTVVIDRQSSEAGGRFALYETMTGGESWMIREVTTRAPRLKRTAGENPVRRVRPHAPTQSYRIEKQEAQRWTPVASFLIRVGECVPAPRELAAPEPPPPPETEAQPAPATPSPVPQARPRTPPSLKKPRP